MLPAQFTKLIAELEHLTDSQTRYVKKLLKGTDSVSQLITELEDCVNVPKNVVSTLKHRSGGGIDS